MHTTGTREYDPGRLLNILMQHLRVRSDEALSARLKIATGLIRDIRHRKRPLPASILLRMQEATGIGVDELRVLVGDRRARLRPSCAVIAAQPYQEDRCGVDRGSGFAGEAEWK